MNLKKMCEAGQLRCHNPTSFLNTVWLNNTAFLVCRAADEHKKVKWGDLRLKTALDGVQHVEREIERGTKARNGVTDGKER